MIYECFGPYRESILLVVAAYMVFDLGSSSECETKVCFIEGIVRKKYIRTWGDRKDKDEH